MGDRCTESLARPTDRSLPALPSCQQQVLRRRRSPHQLHRLSRSPPGCRPPGFRLRCQMSGLPLLGRGSSSFPASGIDHGSRSCKDLSQCEVGVRKLPYAQGEVAERTPDLHRSPDSDRKTGRAVSQLNFKPPRSPFLLEDHPKLRHSSRIPFFSRFPQSRGRCSKGHIRDTKVMPGVAKSHLRRGSSTEVAREAVAVEAVRCVPGGSSLLRCLHS
jgi:hypothetical protein